MMKVPDYSFDRKFILRVVCTTVSSVPRDRVSIRDLKEIHEQMYTEMHAGMRGITYEEVRRGVISEEVATPLEIPINYEITYNNALHFFKQGIIWAKHNCGTSIETNILRHMLNDPEYLKYMFANVWERYRNG